MKNLEQQIRRMKETHITSVCLSYRYLYSDLEYPTKFQVTDFEKYDENGCPQTNLHLYRIAMSQ